MATFKTLEDIIAWQKARQYHLDLKQEIHILQAARDFELKEQLKSSSGSVMDNIAEGFGRGSRNEFIQFLTISRGSLTELQSQLYRCLDRKYLSNDDFTNYYAITEEVAKMLSTFIAYLNKSTLQGNKFKERIAIKN